MRDFDLAAAAHDAMIAEGFHPDFPPAVLEQVHGLRPRVDAGVKDLRSLLWSSIDNDTSRDLDQVEYAERVDGGVRVLVAIADVDSEVPLGSPIDQHASEETTSVYTGIRTFPMLPEELSTDLTSLNEGQDRMAIVIEFVVPVDGPVHDGRVYRAVVRNQAQLTYSKIGAWLEEGQGEVPAALADQLRLQDRAATDLMEERERLGALNFDRIEPEVILENGKVQSIGTHRKNRASELIENFMVAANGVMARTLKEAGVSSIQRVVKSPERWPRIVELAARYGFHLPETPDPVALNSFLKDRKTADGVHYADVSLAVVKLLGPGEYTMVPSGGESDGHFALAAHDYTHSTAPNRRFADTVTQRLVKAVLAGAPAPYTDEELNGIARNCTLKESAARKVERVMNKRMAAVALAHRVGEVFASVVTGVTPKGVFVRVLGPPAEGRLVSGTEGIDVGDQLKVRLVSTDPRKGYIDFARA